MREAYSKIVVELFMSLIIMKKVEDADKNSKQPELHEIFNKQFGKRLPSFINLCTLKKKSTVLITGSTGLVGFNLVQIFLLIDSTYKLDLHIVVSFRNRKKYRCLYPKNQRKRLTQSEDSENMRTALLPLLKARSRSILVSPFMKGTAGSSLMP